MEKVSGLVLDSYDDYDGSEFRALYSSVDKVPDFVKQAHLLSPEERGKLPDEVFDLVMLNDEQVFRKYAMIDEGNTALSVQYFLRNGHKIPVEAQKVAAQNLVTACGWYDIEPPEQLQKIAIGLGGALMGALVIPGAASEAKKNLAASKTGPRGMVMTPQQIKSRRMQMGLY